MITQAIQVLHPEESLETFDTEMYKSIDIGPVMNGICILHKILPEKRRIIIRLITCIIPDLNAC